MRPAWQRILPWWRMVQLSAQVMVLLLSPSSYRPAPRQAMSRHVVAAVAPILGWFTLLSALTSLVITRIVLVTALSYGLSQYALEMVVRVLVLELIPLTAALFVALRWSIPAASELASLRRSETFGSGRQADVDVLRMEVAPRAAAGLFATLLLTAVSGTVSLVLAYVMAHGLSPWGFDGYTRMVGRVFSPAVTLIFVFKSLALSLAVSLIPIGSAWRDPATVRVPAHAELQGLVRMAVAILLIEIAALMGNYYR